MQPAPNAEHFDDMREHSFFEAAAASPPVLIVTLLSNAVSVAWSSREME